MRKNYIFVLLFLSVFLGGALSIHRSGQQAIPVEGLVTPQNH